MMSNLFTFKKMYILIKLLISECSISMVSMLYITICITICTKYNNLILTTCFIGLVL